MSEDEFWKSTPKKIGTLWKLHLKFHGQDEDSEKENNDGVIYKRVNITDVPCLN